jgi:hypothetical protein
MELLAICANIGGTKIDIFNVYIPPTSASPGYFPNFNKLFDLSDKDALFLGDLNAHHSEWFTSMNDARGDHLVTAVDNSSLCFLNGDSDTRLPRAANQSPSSPNVTIAFAHLLPPMAWLTHTTLNSDHLPITFRSPWFSSQVVVLLG